jgi:spore coat polysaccharide biosynthesis predicted glycosyltransferase SpsG
MPPAVRPSILIRAAAGPRIGFGHLVRARTLARVLEADVRISVRGTPAATRRARALGLPLAHAVLSRALAEDGPFDLVIVDDPSEVRARQAVGAARAVRARVAAIRDAGRPRIPADLVIDGSVIRRRAQGNVRAWTGPRYALLDPAIAARRCSRRAADGSANAPRVLIALGGGSRQRLAAAIAEAIVAACPGALARIASGLTANGQSWASSLPQRVEWLGPLPSLADELWACDVAVLAGGMTLYEACALATPAVSLAIVRGQVPAVRAFAAAGAALDGGLCVAKGALALRRAARRVARQVRRVLDDAALRQRLAYNGHVLIDGAGARRVARLLIDAATAGGQS